MVNELRELEGHNNGRTLGRAALNDLTFTVLENTTFPGPELLALVGELLDIDRQRQSKAKVANSQKRNAVWIEAQCKKIGVRKLSELLDVAPSSVTRWRDDPKYQAEVKSLRKTTNSKPFIFQDKSKEK